MHVQHVRRQGVAIAAHTTHDTCCNPHESCENKHTRFHVLQARASLLHGQGIIPESLHLSLSLSLSLVISDVR
jgi:hypothetical protein